MLNFQNIRKTYADSSYSWPSDKSLQHFVESTAVDIIEERINYFYSVLETELSHLMLRLSRKEERLRNKIASLVTLMGDFVNSNQMDSDFIRSVHKPLCTNFNEFLPSCSC